MSTWFSRVQGRLITLRDRPPRSWRPTGTDFDGVDADVRRLRQDLDAICARFSGPPCPR